MREWIISDTHFGDQNIGRYNNRPDDWETIITQNWNLHVDEQDIIYHLGDFSLYNKAEYCRYIEALPGRKILILGNHDKFSKSYYLENGWSFVADSLTVGNLILTHAPVMKLPDGYYNIHGHIHEGTQTVMRHNVCVDMVGFTPLLLSELKDKFENDTERFNYRRGWGMRPSYGLGHDHLAIEGQLIHYDLSQDDGEWIVECQTYPGIIAYGDEKQSAINALKASVFSYLNK